MRQDTKDLIEKIRKLRAIAEDPNIGEREAALFAGKVQDLLARHDLSMSDLQVEQEDYVMEPHDSMYADPWRRMIIHAASRLYFCEVVVTEKEIAGKWRTVCMVIGRAHNVLVAREVATYLIDTTVRLGRGYSSERRHRLGFERGCGGRLFERLEELRESHVSPSFHSDGRPSNLPALYMTELDLVTSFIQKAFPKLTVQNTRSSQNGHSMHGRRAAESVGLGPQVSASGGKYLG